MPSGGFPQIVFIHLAAEIPKIGCICLWLAERLGGCVPAGPWHSQKNSSSRNPTSPSSPNHHDNNHNNHNQARSRRRHPRRRHHPIVEVRLTRRWIFERSFSSSSPVSRPSSSGSTDPLNPAPPAAPPTVSVVASSSAGSGAVVPDTNTDDCSLPTREVTKLRRVKSTASIPKRVIRKLSVSQPSSVVAPAPAPAPVVVSIACGPGVFGGAAAAAAAEEEGEEGEEVTVGPVIVLPDAVVGYEKEGEETVKPVIVLSATVGDEVEKKGKEEEGEEGEENTAKPVIVLSAAVVDSDSEEEEEVKEEEVVSSALRFARELEARQQKALVAEEVRSAVWAGRPKLVELKSKKNEEEEEEEEKKKEEDDKKKKKSEEGQTQLPTPSASEDEDEEEEEDDEEEEEDYDDDDDDEEEEYGDEYEYKEDEEGEGDDEEEEEYVETDEEEGNPGPGYVTIGTYPYPHPNNVLTTNHRTLKPTASILKSPPSPSPSPSSSPSSPKPSEKMSTPSETPAIPSVSAGVPAPPPPAAAKGGSKKDKKAPAPPANAPEASGEAKKPTAKELKEAKKAEKQARRAAEKASRGEVPDAGAGGGSSSGAGPSKPAQSSTAPANASGGSRPAQQQQQQSQRARQQTAPSIDGDAKTVAELIEKRIPFFDHLRENKPSFDLASIHRDVHPSVLRLSMKFRNFEIIGSTARCLYMLLAFKEVINDYRTPVGVALSRNLTQHLGLQISQIATGRKLSISQGNAIRWLKTIASRVPPEVPDSEAKRDLVASIDTYMKERILVAQDVIANVASEKIVDGDVILTYAKSTCVERVLRRALADGKQFSVIVIDSRPYFEGRGMAKNLIKAGIQVKYTTLHALDHVMKTVNKVFLGAHAVFANGACYSRAGTSAVAMTAAEYQKPVMICCEGLKLSDKIVMDSITTNELGPPDALVGENSPIQNHSSVLNLHIVNLLYDLTLPKYITAVITETGFTPPFGIPSVFRLLAEREGTVGAS
ncbi:hypothetical protein TWF730_009654 [Orbilia blumenaviensis]|uniref:Translation initiation factor eIF2B subunit delta n=1 Tax=Orbilia blumenaviensis TaxID=1796055 RepID=A0AAV9UUW7_9PEZI